MNPWLTNTREAKHALVRIQAIFMRAIVNELSSSEEKKKEGMLILPEVPFNRKIVAPLMRCKDLHF